MYLHTSTQPVHTDMIRHQRILLRYCKVHFYRMEGIIIVILCALYCNVFSLVNETCGYRRVLQSLIVSLLASGLLEHIHVFWRQGRWDLMISTLVERFNVSMSVFLMLASPKSLTLPLMDPELTLTNNEPLFSLLTKINTY